MISRQRLCAPAAGLALAALGLLAACSTPTPPAPAAAADQAATDGRVTFSGGAVALGIGFQWGGGTLTFRGQDYPFRASGISIVDVGATRVTGTGTVRNLRNVGDFSGNYVAVSAGVTLAGGGSVGTLRNQNGVTIDGVTTSQGLRLTLAPSGVNITLTGR